MATIKILEGRTVHQIQSGQIIVDLCSVVKELVENSLDAEATSIDVRFRNYGLDSIEVQDNGVGIAGENYTTIALKHYTSKLSSYDDLTSLRTFGFRGEALSSLCALSHFHVITARSDEAPKGTRLDFEASGVLKGTQVVASQKGTIIAVEDIFRGLPVRRRELEKNIKREYGKALAVLQAYACISTQARVSVSNMVVKGKKNVAFATRSNPSTRDNIINVFGAKTVSGLIDMSLKFEMSPTKTYTQMMDPEDKQVQIVGHVSRPSFGEGRQAPDRQMFFVNARPCALPQVAKVFNEVYKSYNLSQSPFVFANLLLDTNAYDVNVSPDKRTILLHEQETLLDSLRTSLTQLFEVQDQTMPLTQPHIQKLPSFKQLTVHREDSDASTYSRAMTPSKQETLIPPDGVKDAASSDEEEVPNHTPDGTHDIAVTNLIENFVGRDSKERGKKLTQHAMTEASAQGMSKEKQRLIRKLAKPVAIDEKASEFEEVQDSPHMNAATMSVPSALSDFNQRIAEQQISPANENTSSCEENSIEVSSPQSPRKVSSSGVIQNAFDRMRARRRPPEVATVTIGSKTTTSIVGSTPLSRKLETQSFPPDEVISKERAFETPSASFSGSLQSFAAPKSDLIKTVGKPQSRSRLVHKQSSESKNAEDEYDSGDSGALSATNREPKVELEDDTSGTNDSSRYRHEASPTSDQDSDEEIVDEDRNKADEETRVAGLIKSAEDSAVINSQDNKKRALQMLKGFRQSSTIQLIHNIDSSIQRIDQQVTAMTEALRSLSETSTSSKPPIPSINEPSTEERLSLTVSKVDFANMQIAGQFNLGFILTNRDNEDLFIIDQHASDEKYNFESLQATAVIQNQRLVHPRVLELTAIEEEIVFQHNDILLKNGFEIEIDTDGTAPVGQRCRLVSLPMSRESTFAISDLEELISLLAEHSTSTTNEAVPRPSKVRRILAMRACRSSIMVGKTLTSVQMRALVRKMGQIDKPWNCPHGRPTMRHICRLDGFGGWQEGDGLVGLEEEPETVSWTDWVNDVNAIKEDDNMEGSGSETDGGHLPQEVDEDPARTDGGENDELDDDIDQDGR